MKLTVSHRITTKFDPARRRLIQSLRMTPTECAAQTTTQWQVSLSSGECGGKFIDGAGDSTCMVSSGGEIAEHTLDISGEVITTDTSGVLQDLKEKVPPLAYMSETRLIRPEAAITALAKEAVAGVNPSQALERAHALSHAVHDALEHSDTPSEGPSSASEALDAGTCGQREFTHLLIAASHAVGVPARFVYGYFASNAVELDTALDEDASTGALVMNAWPGHAWAEIWVEGLGWVGFDPINECCPDERYIRLCSGRDAIDAAPLRATAIGQGAETLRVTLDVRAAEQ